MSSNLVEKSSSKNHFDAIESIIADIKQGKMVIILDGEDRENEGDLVMAAKYITPDAINFMASKARGLICMPMSPAKCDQLKLPMMVKKNQSKYTTNFTVSIEAAKGVTTGISAQDRAVTIKTAANPLATSFDIVMPGHIFPLRAKKGGVLARAGHTEAVIDLVDLADCGDSGVLVEILNPDGNMARRDDCFLFAKRHGLKISTIENLIEYRLDKQR